MAGALVVLAMVSLATIGYASGRGLGLLGYTYGYQYQYCTGPSSEYQYCSTSTTASTTTGSTTSTTSSTTTSTSTTSSTSSSSSSSSTSTSTTTTTPKPGKGCGDKNHAHELEFQCKIKIHDAGAKMERNSGFTIFTFEVSLSDVPIDRVTVNFSTSNGTATAPSDYLAASGSLTFQKGLLAKKRFITIKAKGDKKLEPNETFFVNLSSPSGNAVIDVGQGQGTIKNDD